jgi:7,8-dihydropterin-6-yl-methyl-4-(beta-D-ribofuranosyl)aminobenzene 5'-phosphate synthase
VFGSVISHRHADHATGLKYVLSVNPSVTVYVPADGSNGFGGAVFPKAYLRADESLPEKMRYFGGGEPEHFTSGKLYDTGNFVLVNKLTEVIPGVFLVPTVSQKKGTLELSDGATVSIAELDSAISPRTWLHRPSHQYGYH